MDLNVTDSRQSPKKEYTRADVAKLAGVSEGTVSNVLNAREFVSESSREAVLKAVRQLNYHRNLVARGLSARCTMQMGLVVADLSNPYCSEVVCEVLREARAAGYTLSLCESTGDGLSQAVRNFLEHRVDAVLSFVGGHNPSDIDPLLVREVPLVTCGYRLPARTGIPYVDCDYMAGAAAGVNALVSLGHQEIGLMPGDENPMFCGKLVGWLAALDSHGLSPVNVTAGGYGPEAGREAARTLIDSGARAILAANDLMALDAIAAARDLGLSVPRDISIIGWDSCWFAQRIAPKLTTIKTVGNIMKNAVNMAQELITISKSTSIKLPMELVLGDSVSTPQRTPSSKG